MIISREVPAASLDDALNIVKRRCTNAALTKIDKNTIVFTNPDGEEIADAIRGKRKGKVEWAVRLYKL